MPTFAAAFVALVLFIIFLVWLFADIPSFKELENPESNIATQVIAEGGEILATFHIENRTFVTYDELSPNIVHAAVATEDVRFYKHSGIDFRGLARVLFKTILMRNSSQGGGSTITQQLAKTLYPRTEMKRKVPAIYHMKMVWTKLKEWITAVKLEKNYTKDEIMTMYLNSIFFGSSAYGIRSAAETFFGKAPDNLTVEEIDDALSITCITLRVSHHHDGSTFLVQLGEQLHHFETVFRVEVTSRLVSED